jgi:hypothetical protein
MILARSKPRGGLRLRATSARDVNGLHTGRLVAALNLRSRLTFSHIDGGDISPSSTEYEATA